MEIFIGCPSDLRFSFKQSSDNGRGSVIKAAEKLQNEIKPGDVVLIKGRDTQRFDRISFALMGTKVQCDVDFCDMKVFTCEHCPNLKG